MNDFETRLTEALTSGADQAPDVDGLAAGARARARTRRRTRVVVAACAVVVLAVPVAVLAAGGDDDSSSRIARDPGERKAAGWHTVEHDGVLVEVPRSWDASDDSGCRIGVADAGVCGEGGERLTLYGAGLFDPVTRPGQVLRADDGWAGYVYAGDWAVYVSAAELETARRILGTAREEGQDAPDLSAGWRTESYDGLSIDVPADWREGALSTWCADEAVPGWVERPTTAEADVDCPPPAQGYGIRFGGNSSRAGQGGFTEQHWPEFPEQSWAGVAIVPDENGTPVGYVQVVAPTQGLAELIGGSLRAE